MFQIQTKITTQDPDWSETIGEFLWIPAEFDLHMEWGKEGRTHHAEKIIVSHLYAFTEEGNPPMLRVAEEDPDVDAAARIVDELLRGRGEEHSMFEADELHEITTVLGCPDFQSVREKLTTLVRSSLQMPELNSLPQNVITKYGQGKLVLMENPLKIAIIEDGEFKTSFVDVISFNYLNIKRWLWSERYTLVTSKEVYRSLEEVKEAAAARAHELDHTHIIPDYEALAADPWWENVKIEQLKACVQEALSLMKHEALFISHDGHFTRKEFPSVEELSRSRELVIQAVMPFLCAEHCVQHIHLALRNRRLEDSNSKPKLRVVK